MSSGLKEVTCSCGQVMFWFGVFFFSSSVEAAALISVNHSCFYLFNSPQSFTVFSFSLKSDLLFCHHFSFVFPRGFQIYSSCSIKDVFLLEMFMFWSPTDASYILVHHHKAKNLVFITSV